MATENKRFRIRRDTAANWTAINPILALGEEGYETDTRKAKVGDGSTNWVGLSYREGGSASNAFGTVAVSGQSNVVADQANDTLTLVAGSNVTITTNAAGDSITISATGGGGSVTIVTDPALPGDNTVVPGVQATRTAIANAVAALVASSPAALDTLNELAAALGNDANFAATINTALGNRLVRSSNLSDLTNVATARSNLGLASARTRLITFTFDGGTATPSTGLSAEFSVPIAGTITRAKLLLDAAGSAVVDVRKVAFAGGAPTTSICASAKPTLSSSRRAIVPLTGWTTAIAADDVFVANLESASGFTKATLTLEYEVS